MIEWDDTLAAQIAAMSDHDLKAAYQQTEGQPGDPAADALVAEIRRRELDI